jgi:hypothetical protein
MQPHQKLPGILPRLGQSHTDGDEELRCLLGGGKKTVYRGHGDYLSLLSTTKMRSNGCAEKYSEPGVSAKEYSPCHL